MVASHGCFTPSMLPPNLARRNYKNCDKTVKSTHSRPAFQRTTSGEFYRCAKSLDLYFGVCKIRNLPSWLYNKIQDEIRMNQIRAFGLHVLYIIIRSGKLLRITLERKQNGGSKQYDTERRETLWGPPTVKREVKCRRLSWAGHVAKMWRNFGKEITG
jgi:hypothetical protein